MAEQVGAGGELEIHLDEETLLEESLQVGVIHTHLKVFLNAVHVIPAVVKNRGGKGHVAYVQLFLPFEVQRARVEPRLNPELTPGRS